MAFKIEDEANIEDTLDVEKEVGERSLDKLPLTEVQLPKSVRAIVNRYRASLKKNVEDLDDQPEVEHGTTKEDKVNDSLNDPTTDSALAINALDELVNGHGETAITAAYNDDNSYRPEILIAQRLLDPTLVGKTNSRHAGKYAGNKHFMELGALLDETPSRREAALASIFQKMTPEEFDVFMEELRSMPSDKHIKRIIGIVSDARMKIIYHPKHIINALTGRAL